MPRSPENEKGPERERGRSETPPGENDAGSAGFRRRIGRPLVRSVTRASPPVLAFAVLLAGWQAYAATDERPPVVLPSPLDVLEAGVASWSLLLGDAAVTALTAGLGLAVGGSVGLLVAFASVGSRTVEAMVYPPLVALRIAPVVAIAPLLFLWFGDGLLARATLVATLTAFPVAVGSLDGLRSTPPAYVDLCRTVDAPDSRVFRAVRVPAAAPSVLAGVKIAATLSVIGAVIAEFLTLGGGLGYRVVMASSALRTPRLFAGLFVLTGVGIAFYSLPVALKRRLPGGASVPRGRDPSR